MPAKRFTRRSGRRCWVDAWALQSLLDRGRQHTYLKLHVRDKAELAGVLLRHDWEWEWVG